MYYRKLKKIFKSLAGHCALKKKSLKRIFVSLILIISINGSFAQKNIEFAKENFLQKENLLKTAKRNMKKGDILLSNENYKLAVNRYSEAQAINPDNSLLNYKIGLCLFYTNQDTLAKLAFEKAFDLNNMVADDIYFYLARTNHLSCNFEKAISNYTIEIDSALKKGQFNYVQGLKKFISECQAGNELINTKDSMLCITNLSNAINTVFSEYSPFVSWDDSSMFFTSRSSLGAEDVYYSTKMDSRWSKAINIGKPINTFANDAIVGISKDAKIMYVYSDENLGDLFISHFENQKWTKPGSLSGKINSEFTESAMCFSQNNDTLFFVSNRNGTLGGKDIFYSVKQNGQWQTAVNMGDVINSKYNEESVFVNEDTLYFASQGHNTMGGYDIFKTFRNNNGNWSVPENLGFPVNSPYDDLFYFSSQYTNYLSSDRSGGKGESDIYSLHRIIPFLYTKPDSVIRKAINLFFVDNISFEVNKSQNIEAYTILDSLVKFMTDEPGAKILITGFTDTEGDDSSNLTLSLKRADFVKQYLISKGVSEHALVVDGKGEGNQISRNKDNKGRYLMKSLRYNRRVEFTVLKQGVENKLIIQQLEIPEEYQINESCDTLNSYSIWLMAYIKAVEITSFGLPLVYEYKNSDGVYDYFYGTFDSLKKAQAELAEINKIYSSAFIILNDSFNR